MKKYLITLFVGFLTSCVAPSHENVNFITYQKEISAENSEGVPAELSIKIAIPEENSKEYNTIICGIKDIIKNSKVGEELNQPLNGSLQEIVNSYERFFPIGISDETLYPGCRYDLWIENKYQNDKCISFLVSDGIYGNGGPNEYYSILRLSDGHIMQKNELVDISTEDIVRLAKIYSQQEVNPYDLEEGIYNISPDNDGCKLQYPIGSHFFNEINIPTNEILPYLTKEGKELFVPFNSSDNQLLNMDYSFVLSQEWWRGLAKQISIPSTNSDLPFYCIIVLGLLGMFLLRLNKRIPKISFVICMGILELYYFGYYEYTPDWFLTSDVSLFQKIFTIPVIVTIIVVQCILTDDIFLKDSLEGDQRYAVDTGICFSPLLITALYCILVYIIMKWSESRTFAIFIGYIVLLCIIGITARLIQVKHLGNIAVLLFFVSIISISGILITFSYCIWTGFITLLVYISISSKRNMRSVAYSIKLKADAGDLESIYRMGRIYLIGDGIPKDEQKAVELFQKSADNGNAKAYNDLAKCFLNGTGVNVSKQKAIEYANKSLDLGCSEAKNTLGDIYFGMAKDFRDGNGVVKDTKKAIELFEKAGEYGNSKAYNSLAKCYLSGTGVAQNGQKGLEYATKSYEMGNKNACATIGTYYRMGEFIPEDHVNGHKWDIIGAQAGNVLCQIRVGIDFQKGYGVSENKREACKWFKKVADNKDASQKDRGVASYRYGVLIGILGNIPEGKEYIRKAQKFGNEIALKEGYKYLNS